MRRVIYLAGILLVLMPLVAAIAGMLIGPGILHPANLNPERLPQTAEMLERASAKKEDFEVTAPDGVVLRGRKVRPPAPNGDWVLLFHGVSDNRTGMLGAAEFLLRHHFSLVMMDTRAHGKSGGEMATYGWKERFDTVAITQALFSTESVRHLYARGASMGGAIALQSAAVEPRIEAVVAEATSPACARSPTTMLGSTSARCWGRHCCGQLHILRCAKQRRPVSSTQTMCLPKRS